MGTFSFLDATRMINPAACAQGTLASGPAASVAEIADIVCAHDKILIAAHGNPDGDAVGSMAAMGWLAKALGKQVALYNATGIPQHLEWVPLSGPVYTVLGLVPFTPQLVVALDSGDLWRLGRDLAERFSRYDSINLDHHLGNPYYANLGNLVDPKMAATGQIVAAVADAAQVPLTGAMAEGLYLALVSDTGSFSFGNTSPEVLELTARMMREGLDIERVRTQLDSQWTLAKFRLWGKLFASLRLEDEGRIAVCVVSGADIAEAGAFKSDLEQFAEQMRCLSGVRVALLVREDYPGKIKISLRSRGADDVRKTAVNFGGGGHTNAAGATIDMSLAQLMPRVLDMIRQSLA